MLGFSNWQNQKLSLGNRKSLDGGLALSGNFGWAASGLLDST
jgi:hypothetical protein